MLCKYILLFLQVGENTAKIVFKKKYIYMFISGIPDTKWIW